jgi:hypothetical protein
VEVRGREHFVACSRIVLEVVVAQPYTMMWRKKTVRPESARERRDTFCARLPTRGVTAG